jgi:hypothetical protein
MRNSPFRKLFRWIRNFVLDHDIPTEVELQRQREINDFLCNPNRRGSLFLPTLVVTEMKELPKRGNFQLIGNNPYPSDHYLHDYWNRHYTYARMCFIDMPHFDLLFDTWIIGEIAVALNWEGGGHLRRGMYVLCDPMVLKHNSIGAYHRAFEPFYGQIVAVAVGAVILHVPSDS